MYQSLQISPDGQDFITDYERPTVAEVWELVNDQGSRWFFYPIPFVITAGKIAGSRDTRAARIGRKRIVSACDGFEHLEGLTVASAMREIADNPEEVAFVLS